jgi:hypothetical protein
LNNLLCVKVLWFVSLGPSEFCSMFRYSSASSDTDHILWRSESGEAFGGMLCRHCSLLSGDTKVPGTTSSTIRASVEGRMSFQSKLSSANPNAGQGFDLGTRTKFGGTTYSPYPHLIIRALVLSIPRTV